MDEQNIPQTQKSSPSLIQNQGVAHSFETIPEIKANAMKELKGIKKEAYLDCFRKWKHRWDKCVHWEGEYFEGDPDL